MSCLSSRLRPSVFPIRLNIFLSVSHRRYKTWKAWRQDEKAFKPVPVSPEGITVDGVPVPYVPFRPGTFFGCLETPETTVNPFPVALQREGDRIAEAAALNMYANARLEGEKKQTSSS